jgi:hypothetical protein
MMFHSGNIRINLIKLILKITMMQIKSINLYRYGGSPAITLRNVDPLILQSLGLPDLPIQIAGNGDTCNIYEVWRDRGRTEKRGKYFFGDINGKNIELGKDHPFILRVIELLNEELRIKMTPFIRFISEEME